MGLKASANAEHAPAASRRETDGQLSAGTDESLLDQLPGVRLSRERVPPANHKLAHSGFAADAIAGLSAIQKTLSPKYFYDEQGSALFEAICSTLEYYVTRAETALLGQVVPQLVEKMLANTVLVEFGSGASHKTRVLLDAAPQIAAYVPIDISVSALRSSAARIASDYPAVEVWSLLRDFTRAVNLPPDASNRPRVGFFPGSTIGNFMPNEAVRFLRTARDLLGARSRLIVGADMIKVLRCCLPPTMMPKVSPGASIKTCSRASTAKSTATSIWMPSTMSRSGTPGQAEWKCISSAGSIRLRTSKVADLHSRRANASIQKTRISTASNRSPPSLTRQAGPSINAGSVPHRNLACSVWFSALGRNAIDARKLSGVYACQSRKLHATKRWY